MCNLADLLKDANEHREMVVEDVTKLMCEAGIWNDVEQWEFCEADLSLVVTLAPKSTPDFTDEQLKPLGDAGFCYLHVQGFGPLATFCLINPTVEA